MDSLADTKQTDDPHDASAGLSRQDIELVARADERLAHAYEQIARADEQLARVNEQISKMEQDAAPKKFANGYRRPSRGRPALRGLVGLLLTAGSDRAGRRGSRPDSSRADTVAPNDGA